MSKKIKNQTATGSSQDKLLFTLALLLMAASIVGYYIYSEAHAVVRVLGMLAGIGVSVFMLSKTEKGREWIHFFVLVKKEVQTVVWPSRQETLQMTLIIFVAVTIMGIFLWLVDMFFLWLVQLLTGQGG